MSEQVFLHSGDIYVSNSRVAIGGTTYSTANITSVTKTAAPPNTGCALVMIVAGVLGFIGTMMAVGSGESFSQFIGPMFLMLLVIGAGIAWYRALKPTYNVVLASASGEHRALSSKDGEMIDSVVNAINQAIVSRG